MECEQDWFEIIQEPVQCFCGNRNKPTCSITGYLSPEYPLTAEGISFNIESL
jgi:hypothetical protein